jgi:hypothetical protein
MREMKKKPVYEKDEIGPFHNFIFENVFGEEDAKMSAILLTYFSNFVKNG